MLDDMDLEDKLRKMGDRELGEFTARTLHQVSQKVDNLPCQQKGNDKCPTFQQASLGRLLGVGGLGGLGSALAFAIVWGIGKIENWW